VAGQPTQYATPRLLPRQTPKRLLTVNKVRFAEIQMPVRHRRTIVEVWSRHEPDAKGMGKHLFERRANAWDIGEARRQMVA
jgi:hypothetical protein